ncbi:MAG: NnrS family protein [Gammaproteobacteria bacterium]|nr:MAG: NnrS family protein [Gammaproteobacteria bacterium]
MNWAPDASRNIRDRDASWRLFFPAAALYAALAVPLSLLAMRSSGQWPAGLAGPALHGRELLFGYGLGVVSGYLLTGLSWRQVLSLLGLWLAARLAWLVQPLGPVAVMLQALFGLLLIAIVAPRFLGKGRKLRNESLALLILLLGLSAPLSDLAWMHGWAVAPNTSLTAVLLFAWIMAFMGGRIIAPAAAGALNRLGMEPAARVQPRLEGALILCLGTAAATSLLPVAWPAGLLTLTAAGLVAVRLWRWRLWLCRGRPDLWCLGAGYGWLAIGLLLLGLELLSGRAPWVLLHGVTVGAMGTLTWNVMLRADLQRRRLPPQASRLPLPGTALIAAAVLLRLAAVLRPDQGQVLLGLAAAAWSAAFLMLACRLLYSGRLPPGLPRPSGERRDGVPDQTEGQQHQQQGKQAQGGAVGSPFKEPP